MPETHADALRALTAKADTPAQIAVLRLLPPWVLRQAAMAERDDAVRAALALLPPMPKTLAAKMLARDLGRYLAAGWQWEQHRPVLPDDAPPMRKALHRLALANDGNSLSWQHIHRIADGVRG